MGAFLAKYGMDIILSLITAGALGFCKYLGNQVKQYRSLLEKREDEEVEQLVDKKLEPIYQELEDLRIYTRKQEELESNHLSLIVASYKFRLIQLCQILLQQSYMTQDQYAQLTEFYKLYSGLGGNGQAKEYYERTVKLPIKSEPEK